MNGYIFNSQAQYQHWLDTGHEELMHYAYTLMKDSPSEVFGENWLEVHLCVQDDVFVANWLDRFGEPTSDFMSVHDALSDMEPEQQQWWLTKYDQIIKLAYGSTGQRTRGYRFVLNEKTGTHTLAVDIQSSGEDHNWTSVVLTPDQLANPSFSFDQHASVQTLSDQFGRKR